MGRAGEQIYVEVNNANWNAMLDIDDLVLAINVMAILPSKQTLLPGNVKD